MKTLAPLTWPVQGWVVCYYSALPFCKKLTIMPLLFCLFAGSRGGNRAELVLKWSGGRMRNTLFSKELETS